MEGEPEHQTLFIIFLPCSRIDFDGQLVEREGSAYRMKFGKNGKRHSFFLFEKTATTCHSADCVRGNEAKRNWIAKEAKCNSRFQFV